MTFNQSARRLGIVSAAGTALLSVAYTATLAAGLMSLQSPQQAIGDPHFAMLEILIMLMMPLMIALMVAVHAWAPAKTKVFSLLALVFMSLVAALTCSVHIVLLTVGRQPDIAGSAEMRQLLSFHWPSVPYALDVLAWDVFFALSVLCAALAFRGNRLITAIRVLLMISGVLALAGLSGVIDGNMQLRNIGIVGYAGVFPVVAFLMAILFHRSATCEA